MSFENIVFQKRGSAAWITLNRPDKLNAFVGTMRDEIHEALCECEADDIRAVVITGAGKGFCSGADVRYLAEIRQSGDTDALDRVLIAARNVVRKIRELPKPVIASINGPTAGGGINLALACDLRIAGDRATFGQTFIRLGLHPDWGGTYLLPRIAGSAVACEMMMSGDIITADEACRLGIVNRVVPHDRLESETERMVSRLVKNSPRIIALIKAAIYRSPDSDLREMLDYETAAQKACFEMDESVEGLNAFLEKREPEF